jgi:hypothetical protein
MASVLPNYYTSNMHVEPATLHAVVTAIIGSDPNTPGGLLGDAIDRLGDVVTTLEGLQLSWFGGAAAEAQDFTEQWKTVSAQLFGTQADPMTGVFPRLISALATAIGNYDGAEEYVANVFAGFATISGGGGSGSGNTSVTNTGQTVTTAITETF